MGLGCRIEAATEVRRATKASLNNEMDGDRQVESPRDERPGMWSGETIRELQLQLNCLAQQCPLDDISCSGPRFRHLSPVGASLADALALSDQARNDTASPKSSSGSAQQPARRSLPLESRPSTPFLRALRPRRWTRPWLTFWALFPLRSTSGRLPVGSGGMDRVEQR